MINMENIQELKSQISLLEVQLKSSKQDVEMLKFELKAADSVNENLSKQVEWISVKDRLPTERVEFVLLFNADAPKYNQCVYQGVWFLQEKKFKSDTVHNLLGTITHWMPLPNQPK